jgi:hypothetical protein
VTDTTLPVPGPVTARTLRPRLRATPELAGVAALVVACVVAFLVWPILPTFDLAHEWLWGRDIVHGMLPEVGAYRAPTEHPLALAVMLVLGPLGRFGQHASVAVMMASYVFLVTGTFALARACFGRTVAWAAALLVVTRLSYAALAIRAFIDVPYLALVVWAAALEARQPRRGRAVFVLLAMAGLLRPEAWVLSGLYALWIVYGDERGWRDLRAWVSPVAWTLVAPVIWMATDLALTGNPLWSLTYTSSSAAELNHARSLVDLPHLLLSFLNAIVHWPGLVGGVIGLGLALALVPRRAAIPAILLASGVLTFVVIIGAGLAAIARYVAIAGLMLLVFTAFAAGGWSLLEHGRRRTQWLAVAVTAVMIGGAWTAAHISVGSINYDLATRLDAESGLRNLLAVPAVAGARGCGPVSVPDEKLIAEVRLALDGARAHDVLARSDPDPVTRRRIHDGGLAIVVMSNRILHHPAYAPTEHGMEPPQVLAAPPRYGFVARNRWFAAYARC